MVEAEQFMRIHALKVMTGAVAPTIIDLTPEATTDALALGARGLARTRDVRLERVAAGDRAPVFDVTYADGTRAITLRETLREVDGSWKIARIERRRAR